MVKPSGDWILGVMRVIEVGGAFHWTNQGATLSFPDQGFLRKVSCKVRNGLPYITWKDFGTLRKVLSRHWKSSDGRIRVARAMAKNEQVENLFISQDLLEAAEFEMRGCEMFAEVAYEHAIQEILRKDMIDKADVQKALDMAALEPTRTTRAGRTLEEGGKIRAWVFGGFAHGPMTGLTKATQQHPLLAQLLARYFRQEVPGGEFGAVAALDSVAFKPHKDNNAKDFPAYITTFTEYSGGDLWLEDPNGSEPRVICEGKEPIAGRCVSLKSGVVQFDGSKWHGTEAFDGRRLVAVAYTPKHHRQWTDDTRERLNQLGFPVRRSQSTSMNCRSDNSDIDQHTPTPLEYITSQASLQHTIPPQHHPDNQIPNHRELKTEEASSSGNLKGRFGEKRGLGSLAGDAIYDFGEPPEGVDPAAMVSAKQVMSFLAESSERGEAEPHHASGWDQAAYEASLAELMKKCHAGLYDVSCPQCKEGRGAMRPHRRLHPDDVKEAVLSLDLTGPHVASAEGFRYALVGIYTLGSGKSLMYTIGLRRKTAQETAEGTVQILARLYSLGAAQLVRIHSDGGGEFAGSHFQQMTSKLGVWQTMSAPYCPQANGRAERHVQKLKMGTISLLLHARYPVRFWYMAMREYAYKQRHMALHDSIPRDAPTMGDAVLFRPEKTGDFQPRAVKARFVCHDDRVSNGALVLVERDGRETIVRTYCPRLTNEPRPRWKIHSHPETGQTVWVSTNGQVGWDAPQDGGVLTFEERMLGPALDEEPELMAEGGLQGLASAVNFRDFNHGFLLPSETEAAPGPAVHAATAKVCAVDSDHKYVALSVDEEQAIEDSERLAAILAEKQLTVETVGNDVLSSGGAAAQKKWISAVEGELGNMETKSVWRACHKSEARRMLGLTEDAYIPPPLPMKLVLTKKPILEGGDVAQDAATKDCIPIGVSGTDLTGLSAQALAEMSALAAFKAKCRIVACGNFEQNPGTDLSSQNVDADTLRFLIHLWAGHRDWSGFVFDISAAFLNSWLPKGHKITMKPPGILVKLGYFDPDTLLIPDKSLYGLKRAPRDWEEERGSKLDNKVLKARDGDKHGDLVLKPHADIPGLWSVVTVAEGKLLGFTTMFVDDGLAIGDDEAMMRVLEYVLEVWSATVQGFMGWDVPPKIGRGNLVVPRVEEFVFLGLRITLNETGVQLDQHKWLAQELQRRGLSQIGGSPSLPSLDDAPQEPSERDEHYKEQLRACQSDIGSLMWAAMRTRPDIQAVVSMCARLCVICPAYVLQKLKAVWKYVRKTLWLSLQYAGSKSTVITSYSDCSFAAQGSRSRTGVVLTIGVDIVSWRSVRQKLTAWSVCEGESEAAATGLQDALHLKDIVDQLTGLTHSIEMVCRGDFDCGGDF